MHFDDLGETLSQGKFSPFGSLSTPPLPSEFNTFPVSLSIRIREGIPRIPYLFPSSSFKNEN